MINEFCGEYRFLSNFWPIDITFEGITYPSVEHAYQAAKTVNPIERGSILAAAQPGAAKRAGKRVTKRKDWEEVKLQVMLDLNTLKFEDPWLREKLLDTGDRELIEGNTWNDTFWGVCRGVGENHLGKILMQIRSELR